MSKGKPLHLSTTWKRVATAASLVIIAFLLLAIVGKFATPNPRKTFDLLGTTVKLDYVIAGGEILFVLGLAVFARRRIAWALVTLMFGGFLGYAGYYLFFHDGSCGCFGTLIDLPTWTPFTVDVFAVIAGSALLLWSRFGTPRVAATLFGAAVLGALGFTVAQHTAPPTAAELEQAEQNRLAMQIESESQTEFGENDQNSSAESDASDAELSAGEQLRAARIQALGTRASAPERALRSSLFEDIMQQADGGPAWFVFVYDPACEVCMAKKPDIDDWELILSEEQNTIMQIRQISKEDAERDAQIEYYAWRGSPVVFIVQDGVVTHRWLDESTPLPEDALLGLELGDLAPNFSE